MLVALIVIQTLTLAALAALLLRSRSTPNPATEQAPDPRLAQLLAADLPTQFTRIDTRSDALDRHLRAELTTLRDDSAKASAALRNEVLGNISTLGDTLRGGLEGFRKDNSSGAENLRSAVEAQMTALSQRFTTFTADTTSNHIQSREALQQRLDQLRNEQTEHLGKLRESVEARLDALNASNSAKLEEMRQTVDEKLQKTLHDRLTSSFGLVTSHLGEVQKGLGEMKELATGVGDLKKVLSNVKSRGIVGEFFLGQQLEQMFAPEQYIKDARIKAGTQEAVEYALRVPNGPDSAVLLAIDSKFPLGDWERLEEAYESGSEDDRRRAGVAFERAIRDQAKKICEKYIDPPQTLPFALMYLPTEALYAEVMRRAGLHAEIQAQCSVVIVGPSALTMILTSFQLVFRTVRFQKNLSEVWQVFQVAQTEFEKFSGMMEKVEGQVGTVQRTLKEISGKTKTVNRAFKNVSKLELGPTSAAPEAVAIPQAGFDGYLPMLAASDDDSAGNGKKSNSYSKSPDGL